MTSPTFAAMALLGRLEGVSQGRDVPELGRQIEACLQRRRDVQGDALGRELGTGHLGPAAAIDALGEACSMGRR